MATATLPPAVDVEEVATPYGSFLCLSGDEITRQLARDGGHTRPELAMLLDLVRPGDTVLDVGAHIGTFAVPLATRGATVHAFEPYPQTGVLLVRNAAANSVVVKVWPFVCGAGPGWYDPVLPDQRDTSRVSYVPGSKVMGVSLDDWWRDRGCPEVDVLKVDVEGMEWQVLLGAASLVVDCRPALHVEIQTEPGHDLGAVASWMRSLGYDLFMNTSPRDAPHDRYRLGRLESLPVGRSLFDLLAVHPASDRLPSRADNVVRTQARLWLDRRAKRHRSLARFALR